MFQAYSSSKWNPYKVPIRPQVLARLTCICGRVLSTSIFISPVFFFCKHRSQISSHHCMAMCNCSMTHYWERDVVFRSIKTRRLCKCMGWVRWMERIMRVPPFPQPENRSILIQAKQSFPKKLSDSSSSHIILLGPLGRAVWFVWKNRDITV